MLPAQQNELVDTSQALQATVHKLQLSKNARADEIQEIQQLLKVYKESLQEKARSTPSKRAIKLGSTSSGAAGGPLLRGEKCELT